MYLMEAVKEQVYLFDDISFFSHQKWSKLHIIPPYMSLARCTALRRQRQQQGLLQHTTAQLPTWTTVDCGGTPGTVSSHCASRPRTTPSASRPVSPVSTTTILSVLFHNHQSSIRLSNRAHYTWLLGVCNREQSACIEATSRQGGARPRLSYIRKNMATFAAEEMSELVSTTTSTTDSPVAALAATAAGAGAAAEIEEQEEPFSSDEGGE